MKGCSRWMLALLAGAGLAFSAGLATADEVAGIRKDMMASLADAGGKLVELAQAMPAKKYEWRPAKEARSASEIYLHVVAANYGIPAMMLGVAPAPNSPVNKDNFMTFDKSTTDKAKIEAMLKESFEYAKQAIAQVPDADLGQEAMMMGMKTTKGGALLVLVNHAHEHLGQSIAYARSNGVTPPWTAREQAEQAKAKEKSGK